MSDRTGRAPGTLSPLIYFENKNGRLILPPEETGNTGLAKRLYEEKFKHEGYEWREAGSLQEVDRFQKRYTDQLNRERAPGMERMVGAYEAAKKITRDRIYARMISSGTSAWERDFLEIFLRKREGTESKFYNAFSQYTGYIHAREMDDSKQPQDMMPDEPGDFWRTEQQQKA